MASMRPLGVIFADVLVLIAVTAIPSVLRGFGTPPTRGFYCDDETIRYPYVESTISIPLLYIIGVGIVVPVIVVTELLTAKSVIRETVCIFGIRMPSWVTNCYKYIGAFSFGSSSSELIIQTATYTLGRLRPNFIDVCEPDVDCSLPETRYAYISNYTCLGPFSERIHDARLSFPSGHATFGSYAAVFVVLYIQKRWHIESCHLLKPAVQLFCVALSLANAVSRIHDFKHHWDDVVVGLLIGTSVAVFLYTFVLNLFRSQHENAKVNHPSASMSPINGSVVLTD